MNVALPIAQHGEEILQLKATPVAESEFNSEWLKQLALAMHQTMLDRYGVGIAAPQVYVSKRVLLWHHDLTHAIPMRLRWMQ